MSTRVSFGQWCTVVLFFAFIMGLPLFVFALAFGDSIIHYDAVAFMHNLPPSSVHDMRKGEPHTDCDFLAAPVGEKPCHYEVAQNVHWHARWHGVEFERPGAGHWSDTPPAFDLTWLPVSRTSLQPEAPDGSPFPAEIYLHWHKVQD